MHSVRATHTDACRLRARFHSGGRLVTQRVPCAMFFDDAERNKKSKQDFLLDKGLDKSSLYSDRCVACFGIQRIFLTTRDEGLHPSQGDRVILSQGVPESRRTVSATDNTPHVCKPGDLCMCFSCYKLDVYVDHHRRQDLIFEAAEHGIKLRIPAQYANGEPCTLKSEIEPPKEPLALADCAEKEAIKARKKKDEAVQRKAASIAATKGAI